MTVDQFVIELISSSSEQSVKELIRRNLEGYEEAGTVIASTFRRLSNILSVYQAEGARYFVLKDTSQGGVCAGGAGIGSLHGLPVSEGVGEVRDLVLDAHYRGRGLGARLLKRCVDEAKVLGYRSLYLETTPKMENAQKLFMRFGFRPVTLASNSPDKSPKISSQVPSYFILEKLDI
jgi:putative acetyltransferase